MTLKVVLWPPHELVHLSEPPLNTHTHRHTQTSTHTHADICTHTYTQTHRHVITEILKFSF